VPSAGSTFPPVQLVTVGLDAYLGRTEGEQTQLARVWIV
jgi:hypothetical protein